MSHLIVIADTLQDILDHEFVIDVTFYRTENVYHGQQRRHTGVFQTIAAINGIA